MHYVSVGAGSGIILLHGWPGFWFDYRHVLPQLKPLGHVVAPDFFGFGDSETIPGDAVSVASEASFAADVLELLDALTFDRIVVVGHDIGSAVAAALARLAPDRVRGLVLLNPTHQHIGAKRYSPEAQREAWYQHFHLLPLAEHLIDGDRRSVALYLSHFYEHWAGRRRIEPGELATFVEVYGRRGAFASSLAWHRARAAHRTRGELPAVVKAPTIALWGDSDPMRPLAHQKGFERTFPHSTSRVLSGVGHFVPAEAPDEVVEAVAELLEG